MFPLKQFHTRLLEYWSENKAAHEPPKVSGYGNTTLHLQCCRKGNELLEQPKAENNKGRHIYRSKEYDPPVKYPDIGSRPDHEIGGYDTAYSPRGTNQRHFTPWIDEGMRKCPRTTAYKIKRQITVTAKCFLNIIAVQPEKPHISDEMH